MYRFSIRFLCSKLFQHKNITSVLRPVVSLSRNVYTKKALDSEQSDPNTNSFTYRTHTCGELRPEHVGQEVTLCGWVQYLRLSKFLLLRDGYGLTQCIIGEKQIDLSDISLETIVLINGHVILRPRTSVNMNMLTGDVEVAIDKLEVLNVADKLPFNLRNYQKPKEQLRLQHRYVDLRFPTMQNNLRHRSSIIHNMRRFLIEEHNFVEVETPTLFCRTPGGAREFVVPTHHPELFYSLVQSPQQFKQMLMAGAIDRYFQVARCYRDESTRSDRQPEFTQLDIEMSFTTLNGVLTLIEQMLHHICLKNLPQPPFRRMTYKEALEHYGTDKPNPAWGLELKDVKHFFSDKENTSFSAYALSYPKNLENLSAKYKEKIRELQKKYNVKVILNEKLKKELGCDIVNKIQTIAQDNRTILVLGNEGFEDVCLCLGEVREMIITIMKSKNMFNDSNDDIQALWIIDFPLFTKGENGLESCHHPFSAPHPDDIHLLDSQPLKVRSLAYDLVMNGNEIGGGSVRVHNFELQEKLLKILKLDRERLLHFLNALRSGCPPHAGIALGLDRLMSVICKAETIREVIAFPKSHDGRDPLSGAPNIISDDDKNYYHICTRS